MITALIALLLLLWLSGGGWGYGRGYFARPGYEGPGMGLLWFIVLIALIVWLVRGVAPAP